MYVQFAELPVVDQNRAKRFYAEKLGCEIAADAPMGEGGWRWVEVRFPGAETALHFVRRKDDRPADEPTLVLVTAEVRGAVEDLRSKGVDIVTEPQEAPWDRGRTVAEFRDSEGNRMVIASR